MKKNDAEALRKKLAPLQSKLYEIERAEKKAKHRALIGKCFKFRNNCGGEEYWWFYAKITAAGNYWPEAFAFQTKTKGEIEIQPKYDGISIASLDGSWKEIDRKEYDQAWRELQVVLRALKP